MSVFVHAQGIKKFTQGGGGSRYVLISIVGALSILIFFSMP